MEKISIIIPIFNSEKYIGRCIQSVITQSFKDFELILVDDGSSDSSYEIANRYADLDPRIVLVKKDNGGVSSARNRGLELASGKYVCFIDSDDYIYPDYLEKMHSEVDDLTEFVFSGMDFSNNDIVVNQVIQKDYNWDLYNEYDFIDFLFQPLQSSPCAKLYSQDIIKKANLRFDTALSLAEDRDFNLKYFRNIRKAISISYSGYCYRIDVPGSLTKKIASDVFKYKCLHWRMKYDMCKERSFNNVETQTRLANELYYFANDEVMRISGEEKSYLRSLMHCKKNLAYVDFSFLRMNKLNLSAPRWQSFLLLHRRFAFLIFIYRIYLYGKAKG